MKGWMKKLGFVGIGLFGVILVAIITIPWFVDVDKYRPQIISTANQYIQGKLDIGKLSLSLWGQIRINVGGFSIADPKGVKIISADDVFFHVPFLSIFSGSPIINFKLHKPTISVLKDRRGKINLLSLKKATPVTLTKETPPAARSESISERKLPTLVLNARMGIEINQALVSYKDEATSLMSQFKDVNFIVKDLSMTRPITIELWGDVDTEMKPMKINGPIKAHAQVQPSFRSSDFEHAKVELQVNMDGLEISIPNTFHKTKDIAFNANSSFLVTPRLARIEKMKMKFHNAECSGSGEIAYGDTQSLDINVKSNAISLAPFTALLPPIKSYELSGNAQFEFLAKGPLSPLGYSGALSIVGLTAKAPHLKVQPRIDTHLRLSTDRIESVVATVKAPGTDLRLSGKIDSFSKPSFFLDLTSKSLDLDQLIEFPKNAAKATPEPSTTPSSAAPSPAKTPTADYDKSLNVLRENKFLSTVSGKVSVSMDLIKAYDIRISEIRGTLSLRDLVLAVESFRMALWSGKLSATASLQMKPKTPLYRFSSSVEKLNLQQAVSSSLALFKNTVLGIATFKMEASGASFNPDLAISNLNSKGNLHVDKAVFTTIDVGKMASEAINKSIDGLVSKVPPLKGKTLQPIQTATRYEFITSDFTIESSKFSAPNFYAKAEPKLGVDLRGHTVVGLKDYSLKADWEIQDTYNLTKARDISVEQGGIVVEHILAEGDQPVKIPVQVSGTLFQPSFNYAKVPEALGKIALANVAKAAEGRAKAELRKRAEEQAKKLTERAPKPIQEVLKGLPKKLPF